MVFGLGKRTRAIADYDFDVREGWHGVELDRDSNPGWADEVAQEAGAVGEVRTTLSANLRAVQTRLIGADEPGLLAAVWIPVDEEAHVKCVLAWRITEIAPGETPDSYEAKLGEDEGASRPGEQFDIVKTWQVAINAGIAVGAYNLITYTDPGDALGRSEARTVVAVFPPKASQMIEFVFTTQDLATFDDLVDMSMGSMATVTVELEK